MRGISLSKKVLIVLDQFEQWLHAKKEAEHSELVQALRQCDGIVMVRDDFWMAVIRFLCELEIRAPSLFCGVRKRAQMTEHMSPSATLSDRRNSRSSRTSRLKSDSPRVNERRAIVLL